MYFGYFVFSDFEWINQNKIKIKSWINIIFRWHTSNKTEEEKKDNEESEEKQEEKEQEPYDENVERKISSPTNSQDQFKITRKRIRKHVQLPPEEEDINDEWG